MIAQFAVNADGLVCPICLEDFKGNDYAVQLSCDGTHCLCEGCYKDFYYNSGMRIGRGPGVICPTCRGVSEHNMLILMYEGFFSGLVTWLYLKALLIQEVMEMMGKEKSEDIVLIENIWYQLLKTIISIWNFFMRYSACAGLFMTFLQLRVPGSVTMLLILETMRFFVKRRMESEEGVNVDDDDVYEEENSIIEITEEVEEETTFENPIEISDDDGTDDDDSIEMIVEGTRADYPIVID